jgi:tripartite-type tricarboxylate transporter receptor subunit TctC
MRKITAILVAAIACVAATGNALAQQYPTKAIRMIVPFPPGGGNDSISRIVAQKMSEGLGQPVVVINRPGAGTTLGTADVARSAADGYTLLLSSVTSQALAPHLYDKPGYDPIKDFTGISMLATTPYILVVGPSQIFQNVQDVIAAAKAKPGSLSFASGGIGSNTHLAGAMFEDLTGTRMTHVPYKGSAPADADMMGGVVNMMFDTVTSVTPLVASGQLRALAVTGEIRLRDFPKVPTFTEAGVKGFDAGSWYSIHVPAGTPKAIIVRLNAEVVRVVNLPDVQTRLRAIGAEPVTGTPEELNAFSKTEYLKWGELIKKLGVRAE